jgi:hypothetical protein
MCAKLLCRLFGGLTRRATTWRIRAEEIRQMNAPKLGFLLLLAFVLPAGAVPLTVASYTMENGGGGALDYHDFSYLPCPNNGCDITSYPLSGGTGKLTDGVPPMTNWDAEGTQTQWVGWSTFDPFGKNARVTFFFPDTVTVQTVTVGWTTV